MPALRMQNKVAIVTGAGSVGPGWGNGRAMATVLAREGARVVVADRDDDAAAETVRLVREEGGECHPVRVDVTDTASVQALVDATVEKYGRLDVLVNNVGASIAGDPTEMTVEQFRGQLDLNLTSVFITCKASLPVMQRQGGGSIVNIGSTAGMRHLGHDYIGYASGKAGVVQFSRQIAVKFGRDNIRCNTVILGLMDTPLLDVRVGKQPGKSAEAMRESARARVPLGRRGDAFEGAHAVLFLASDDARYITGTEILVDGGLMARSA